MLANVYLLICQSTGVRYTRDQVTGRCVSSAIANSSFDVGENTTVTNETGSYVIHMKDPMQLFYLDSSYAYTGQVSVTRVLIHTKSVTNQTYLFQQMAIKILNGHTHVSDFVESLLTSTIFFMWNQVCILTHIRTWWNVYFHFMIYIIPNVGQSSQFLRGTVDVFVRKSINAR